MMSEDQIEFEIKGTPKSWKAPQFNRKTGNVYKPKQDRTWQESIWGQAMPYAPQKPWTGPLQLHLAFRFLAPRSWPKWKAEIVADRGWPMTSRPDLDNLTKNILDALKGVFFVDDAQIVWSGAGKGYVAQNPGVTVRLFALPRAPERKPKE
jgi:Holliday junction resolvase RusA-like endonuclease